MANSCLDFNCDCCHNELNLDKLCVKKLKAGKICANRLNLDESFCAREISTPFVCADQVTSKKLDADSACIRSVNASESCSQNLKANNAQVMNLVANDVCIPGTLRAANVVWNNKYKATAVYSQPLTNYILGSDLNFDLEIDDPNNNLLSGPTRYTAPVSGYYMVMMQIDQTNLAPIPPFGPLLGVPVANLILLVNGVDSRQLYSSYLTFLNKQRSTLTAIMRLVAGDVVTAKLKVLAVDQASGFTEVTGSIDIEGNAINQNESIFSIHILSADGNGIPVPCQPVLPCSPCTPMQCVPCVPGSSTDCPCPPVEPVPAPSNVRARLNR